MDNNNNSNDSTMRYIMEDSTNYNSSSIHQQHHHNDSGAHLYPPDAEASTNRRKGRRTSRQPHAAAVAEQSAIIVEPTEFDVLCAKEKFAIVHTGTRRFRTLIDDYQGRYAEATTKEDKMRITKEIVGIVERTGRFLRYTKGAEVPYEELTHLEARDKTSHALRTACKRFQRKMNRQGGKELLASSALMPLPLATEIRTSPVRSSFDETMPAIVTSKKTTTALPSMARPPIVRRFTTNELAPLPLHSSASITEGGNTFSDDFLSLLKQQVFDDSYE